LYVTSTTRDIFGVRNTRRIFGSKKSLSSGGRAERIQKIFSLDYDAEWERPKPR